MYILLHRRMALNWTTAYHSLCVPQSGPPKMPSPIFAICVGSCPREFLYRCTQFVFINPSVLVGSGVCIFLHVHRQQLEMRPRERSFMIFLIALAFFAETMSNVTTETTAKC